jgi:hypothetical protein
VNGAALHAGSSAALQIGGKVKIGDVELAIRQL